MAWQVAPRELGRLATTHVDENCIEKVYVIDSGHSMCFINSLLFKCEVIFTSVFYLFYCEVILKKMCFIFAIL